MHIPDWDERFMAKFDARRYVNALCQMHVNSLMHYANSHVGLCYYPTKVGAMHKGLARRDIFGEVLQLCKERDIAIIAYYSVIYNNWAYIEHPEWRMLPWGIRRTGRYGVCCPNSPYRQFALAQIDEIVSGYDLDGIFFDMTFWPGVCYCYHCAERYRKETGDEMPRIVNWKSPQWVRLQRTRERWIAEFAEELTAKVRAIAPNTTVSHQFSTLLHDWKLAVPIELADQCDYVCGDFYGETIQQSVVCKAFADISKARPFEFHTSISPILADHVSVKHTHRLLTQAALAPAHSAAIMFIHAIDPDGTLNESVCRYVGEIFAKTQPYEPFLGGELCADVGVYFSLESRFDPDDNGKSVEQPGNLSARMPHLESLMGACKALQQSHIPFGIVTKRGLHNLDKYQVLVLPDVLMMDAEEVKAIRAFVEAGGSLYVSGRAGLTDTEGRPFDDFPLADVLGVSRINEAHSETLYQITYFTPVSDLFASLIEPQKHLFHPYRMVTITNRSADVLATVTMPYYDPDKGDIFAPSFSSIHSNPPGETGTQPAIVYNRFGEGQAIYSAGTLEAVDHHINRRVFVELIRMLLKRPNWFEADAHHSVEVVVFHQPQSQRMLISLLNSQKEFPNAQVDVTFRVRVPDGKSPVRLLRLPEQTEVEISFVGEDYIQAKVDGLEVFAMFALEYE